MRQSRFGITNPKMMLSAAVKSGLSHRVLVKIKKSKLNDNLAAKRIKHAGIWYVHILNITV